jgi:GNAT superfamily N-acetyltransferase
MRPMIELRCFDPVAASAAEWACYHAFRRAQAEQDDPGEPVPADADFEQDARKYRPLYEIRRDVAWRDGAIVGNVGYWLRRPGSPDHATYAPFVYVWGGVLHRWRRLGTGARLAGSLLAFMQARDKTIATFNARLPEGHAFLAAIGAVEKHRSITNRLALADVDWARLAQWQQAADGSGLRWEVHAGRVPVDRLTALQPQLTALLADVPLGSLDRPPIRYELSSYLSWYEDIDRRGGAHLLALLLDGDRVAGMSEASWDARTPDLVHQELTAVARPWRGRGLAKALKAATLRQVRERLPRVRTMTTSNAEANAPILAINQRMGFVAHRRDSSYQIGRDGLAAWLASRST